MVLLLWIGVLFLHVHTVTGLKDCYANSKTYPSGTSFQVGCNICSCSDGFIRCTSLVCFNRLNQTGTTLKDGLTTTRAGTTTNQAGTTRHAVEEVEVSAILPVPVYAAVPAIAVVILLAEVGVILWRRRRQQQNKSTKGPDHADSTTVSNGESSSIEAAQPAVYETSLDVGNNEQEYTTIDENNAIANDIATSNTESVPHNNEYEVSHHVSSDEHEYSALESYGDGARSLHANEVANNTYTNEEFTITRESCNNTDVIYENQ